MLYRMKMKAARLKERVIVAIAWALPKTLVMWCAVRVGAHATTGEHSTQIVPELGFMDALKRWETA